MAVRTNWYGATEFTILTAATGVVTVTQQLHTIAAEAGVEDDLVTITPGYSDLVFAGVTFRPLLILQADVGDTITLKHVTPEAVATGFFSTNERVFSEHHRGNILKAHGRLINWHLKYFAQAVEHTGHGYRFYYSSPLTSYLQ